MNRRKRYPFQSSLRRKALIWFSVMIFIIVIAFVVFLKLSTSAAARFDLLVNDNLLCYRAHESIKGEKEAFETFVRAASQENRQNYEEACMATQQSIDALPFDYAEIGEERYARTWNLKNGYAGYREFRNAMIAENPGDEIDVEKLYRVMEMQDVLADYALRLTEATLEQGRISYRLAAIRFRFLPIPLFGLLAIVILSVFFIMRALSGSVLNPLLRMSREARKIAANDFSGPDLPEEGNLEVEYLIREFNRMKHATAENIANLEKLHRQELTRLELEKNLGQTRLEMLKSQVNPHFLFNTLHMISCMAKLEEAETTDRMILALSSLFRYNLRTKDQLVSLEQELDALEDYMYIQQMRFDSRFTYCRKIEVDPRRVQIPSFTLQPIVENAFVHGLHCKEEDGKIVLRVRKRNNAAVISIADNGCGMTRQEKKDLLEQIQKSEQTGRGIGLGNICKRIGILYKDGKFRIYSKAGVGTVIQLTIPQDEEEE